MTSQLSSDILEQQFGPTRIEILLQHDDERIICTKSEAGQLLEISHVDFNPAGVAAFPAVHQIIIDGKSMGKAFRAANEAFERTSRASYQLPASGGFQQWFGSGKTITINLVTIKVGTEQIVYADILEIYSPVVNWPATDDKPTPEQLALVQKLDGFLQSTESATR